MPFTPAPDDWLEIPAGRYTIGLTPGEARDLARQSAAWIYEKGIDLSPNEGKMMMKAAIMMDTTGNPAWVEQYLLETYPAREIELSAYAIARRPITNRQYREFMADTGETQTPESWSRADGNDADELPARGLSWWLAIAIADWAHLRLPFGVEWERAVRGRAGRLFPWGNVIGPLSKRIYDDGYFTSLPAAITRTAEGFEGALSGSDEWCAELGGEWSRLAAGASIAAMTVPSGVSRLVMGEYTSYAYADESACVRLVRADHGAIAPPSPATPARMLAIGVVRQFESRVLRPLFATLQGDRIGRLHRIVTDGIGNHRNEHGYLTLWLAANPGTAAVRHGLSFIAESRESIRRIPREHGLFLWTVQYRIDDRGEARARPVVAFRMAFDKGIHRFEHRFRASEPDTRIAELTAELIRASVLDAFQYYEIHADSDVDPFERVTP